MVLLLARGVTPKLCCSAGFYINLCTIHFYDFFAKYRNLTKNIASEKVVVESLQSEPLAKRLRPALKNRENILCCDFDVRAFSIR